MCAPPTGTCATCAYLALEPSEEWDVCTHKRVWHTQTYLDETCEHYSTEFDQTNLAWYDREGFDGDLSDFPNAGGAR